MFCLRTLYFLRFILPIINFLANAELFKLHLCEDHQRYLRVWSNGWNTSSISCQVQLFWLSSCHNRCLKRKIVVLKSEHEPKISTLGNFFFFLLWIWYQHHRFIVYFTAVSGHKTHWANQFFDKVMMDIFFYETARFAFIFVKFDVLHLNTHYTFVNMAAVRFACVRSGCHTNIPPTRMRQASCFSTFHLQPMVFLPRAEGKMWLLRRIGLQFNPFLEPVWALLFFFSDFPQLNNAKYCLSRLIYRWMMWKHL